VVSTPHKNVSQLGLLFPFLLKKQVPNHQPVDHYLSLFTNDILHILLVFSIHQAATLNAAQVAPRERRPIRCSPRAHPTALPRAGQTGHRCHSAPDASHGMMVSSE
jgi:hypothetical protein